jgi:hypothetical protein
MVGENLGIMKNVIQKEYLTASDFNNQAYGVQIWNGWNY